MNEEVTIRAILEGGVISSLNGTTRVTDRFFLSSNQIRGFSSRGVGPRDTEAGISDVLGGNKYAALRFEADFPLGLPEEYGISGGVFADFGSLWDLDDTAGEAGVIVDDGFELRSSLGVSIFWTTPIGPLRLNFAKPIQKNALDEENTFDITGNHEPPNQSSSGHGVFDSIGHRRLAMPFGKDVLMSPELVRSTYLLVDEPEWRLPNGDPGSPLHRNTAPVKSIVDDRALCN